MREYEPYIPSAQTRERNAALADEARERSEALGFQDFSSGTHAQRQWAWQIRLEKALQDERLLAAILAPGHRYMGAACWWIERRDQNGWGLANTLGLAVDPLAALRNREAILKAELEAIRTRLKAAPATEGVAL